MADVLVAAEVEKLPVEVVAWPADAVLRDRLARGGVPRLLLVHPDAAPPSDLQLDEDWIRLPASAEDISARAARLATMVAILATDEPFVDDDRVLHRGVRAVTLTATEAALMRVLLARRGAVVSFTELQREVWGHPQTHDAIDAAMYRLRRRVRGLDVLIRSVRNLGFVIDRTDPARPAGPTSPRPA